MSFGKSVWSIYGMSDIVFKFKVMSSPHLHFLLITLMNLPPLYVREADIPSILGSALCSNSKLLFKFKKLTIFFKIN